VVLAGLAANLVIFAAKTSMALITGSSALLAESFHSAVDTANSLLLLFGERRSHLPADEIHPFGHGKELYFWSFVVAVSMFAVGGIMSIYEGVQHFLHPTAITAAGWAYVVLAISVSFSTVSLVIGLREINRGRGERGLIEYIRQSKDPAVFTVVLEDVGDVAGELLAAAAIFCATRLHWTYADGAGSVLIGLAMISVSGFLANESRGLLVGESATKEQVEEIRTLVTADPAVERVGKLMTMQLGPEQVLLNLEVEFYPQGSIDALEETIERITRKIRQQNSTVKQVYLEAAALHAPAAQKRLA
jgi:cation diffusion facilitator family transporter